MNKYQKVKECKGIAEIGKPYLFLISGRAGTGKSLAGKFLLESAEDLDFIDCRVDSFARSVKKVAFESFIWNRRKDEAGRNLLQGIGNLGREYYLDMWVSRLYTRATTIVVPDVLIVDDWRFPNEEEFLRLTKMFFIKTVRIFSEERESLKGTPFYEDVSETSLPLKPTYYDYAIYNGSTALELKEKVSDVLYTTMLEQYELYKTIGD